VTPRPFGCDLEALTFRKDLVYLLSISIGYSVTMAETTPKATYSDDPTLYLYTSLTAGSSHIITATSRLETILKANKISFKALDVATDEKARMLWGRRSKGKKLPGLVRYQPPFLENQFATRLLMANPS
jgi:hypothetical protein